MVLGGNHERWVDPANVESNVSPTQHDWDQGVAERLTTCWTKPGDNNLEKLAFAANKRRVEDLPVTATQAKKARIEEPESDSNRAITQSGFNNDSMVGVNVETNPVPALSEKTMTIAHYTDRDVLLGRGGGTNSHPGNRSYREQVNKHKDTYMCSRRHEKAQISQRIVDEVHQRDGRFLEKAENGRWKEVDNLKARLKTSQAFREGASHVQTEARGPRNKLLNARMTQRIPPRAEDASLFPLLTEALLLDHYRHCRESTFCHLCAAARDSIARLNIQKRVTVMETAQQVDPEQWRVPVASAIPPERSLTYRNISSPTNMDVTFGKGKAVQDYEGNRRFRDIVNMYKEPYQTATSRAIKTDISLQIVREIRSYGGRFLQVDATTGIYHDVGDVAARAKVSHALRARDKPGGGMQIMA